MCSRALLTWPQKASKEVYQEAPLRQPLSTGPRLCIHELRLFPSLTAEMQRPLPANLLDTLRDACRTHSLLETFLPAGKAGNRASHCYVAKGITNIFAWNSSDRWDSQDNMGQGEGPSRIISMVLCGSGKQRCCCVVQRQPGWSPGSKTGQVSPWAGDSWGVRVTGKPRSFF